MNQYKIIAIIFMVFFHIIDDYYLQGILAKLKQKSYWEENAPEDMYKNDYLVALFMHSFSWSVSIHIPLFIYNIIFNKEFYIIYLIVFYINIVIHYNIDNLKANKKLINLETDQLIHIGQISITHGIWFLTDYIINYLQ